ncbi:hypothetical protein NDU88_004795 [Pleurodeles waltl]|uniref:Uncharacterized protein n=1 Tax=Pleurodeles waltl TaxID=8319 RepID=A0AAV7SJY1_PLEWA|nr:hypothetical protein NDU88_004795 [Pleurodeles waltl]
MSFVRLNGFIQNPGTPTLFRLSRCSFLIAAKYWGRGLFRVRLPERVPVARKDEEQDLTPPNLTHADNEEWGSSYV